MICKHCGAPLEFNEEKCSYCGSITPYGLEKLKHEVKIEKNQEKINQLPKMKYSNIISSIVIYVCTFFIYSPYWYFSRADSLNKLTDKKLNKWIACLFLILYLTAIFMPKGPRIEGEISQEQEIFNYLMYAIMGLSIWLALRVRAILRKYAADCNKTEIALLTAPSIILLVLFGPLYLQYSINKMIKINLLSPEI